MEKNRFFSPYKGGPLLFHTPYSIFKERLRHRTYERHLALTLPEGHKISHAAQTTSA
jgi:hypothetical protein